MRRWISSCLLVRTIGALASVRAAANGFCQCSRRESNCSLGGGQIEIDAIIVVVVVVFRLGVSQTGSHLSARVASFARRLCCAAARSLSFAMMATTERKRKRERVFLCA